MGVFVMVGLFGWCERPTATEKGGLKVQPIQRKMDKEKEKRTEENFSAAQHSFSFVRFCVAGDGRKEREAQ